MPHNTGTPSQHPFRHPTRTHKHTHTIIRAHTLQFWNKRTSQFEDPVIASEVTLSSLENKIRVFNVDPQK